MTRREFSLSKTEQNTNKNPPKQTQNPNPILLPSAEARIGAAAVTQPGTGQNAVLVMVGTGLRHWGCQVAILIVCICWCEFKIIPQAFKCVCNMNNFLYQICFAFKCRSIHLLPTLISLVPGNAVLYWAFSLFPMSWHFFFRLHILSHFYKMLEWPTRPGRSFARPSSDGSSFSGSHQSTWANKNMGWSGSGRGCEGHLTWFSDCLLWALLIDLVEISADCVAISGQGWLLFFAQPIPDFSWESVLPTFKISYGHQHALNPHCLRCATQQD